MLYELALDYWKADQRTDAVSVRDGNRAEDLFNKVFDLATAAGDNQYVEDANMYREKVKQWRKNLDLIKE